jgi:hypothetical protein
MTVCQQQMLKRGTKTLADTGDRLSRSWNSVVDGLAVVWTMLRGFVSWNFAATARMVICHVRDRASTRARID